MAIVFNFTISFFSISVLQTHVPNTLAGNMNAMSTNCHFSQGIKLGPIITRIDDHTSYLKAHPYRWPFSQVLKGTMFLFYHYVYAILIIHLLLDTQVKLTE